MTTNDAAVAWLNDRLGKPVQAEVRLGFGAGESVLLQASGILSAADGLYVVGAEGARLDLAGVPPEAPFACDEDELTVELGYQVWLYVIEELEERGRRPAGRAEV
jgi:hypothetical protein